MSIKNKSDVVMGQKVLLIGGETVTFVRWSGKVMAVVETAERRLKSVTGSSLIKVINSENIKGQLMARPSAGATYAGGDGSRKNGG
jgi:hypothetical protein